MCVGIVLRYCATRKPCTTSSSAPLLRPRLVVCVSVRSVYITKFHSFVCLQVATPKSDWAPSGKSSKWGKSDWAPKDEWKSESKSGWAPKGEGKAGSSKQGDKRKSESTCYKCGEAGHMAYQCPSKKQKQWN